MVRVFGCLAVALLATLPLRAGELDAEYTRSIAPASVAAPATPDLTLANWSPAELDAENPTQACGWRRGFGFGFSRGGWGGGGWGWGGGWGGGGWGWGGGWGPTWGTTTLIGYRSIGLGWGGGYGCWW